MTKVVKFWRLPLGRKRLLCEAVAGFIVIKFLSKVLPFRSLAGLFGRQGMNCPEDVGELPTEILEIRWAIRTAARSVPWGKKCLIQALTAKWMAHFRGYRTTFYLGVGRNDEQKLIYHAWLQYRGVALTGGKTDGVYRVLDSFY